MKIDKTKIDKILIKAQNNNGEEGWILLSEVASIIIGIQSDILKLLNKELKNKTNETLKDIKKL